MKLEVCIIFISYWEFTAIIEMKLISEALLINNFNPLQFVN